MGNTTEETSNNKPNPDRNHSNWFQPQYMIPAIATIIVALIGLSGAIYSANKQAGAAAAATPIDTTAAPTTPIPSSEIEPMVIATQPTCPAPRGSRIGQVDIVATVTIARPSGECPTVSRNETIEVRWSVNPADSYYLWVLVFSPITRQYYPHTCDTIPLHAEGVRQCQVTFGKAEPYEIVIVLAGWDANAELGKHTQFGESALPTGIEEKAALSVYGAP